MTYYKCGRNGHIYSFEKCSHDDHTPVVVIDLEDDKRVEEFWRMAGQSLPTFREALREYANPKPPKPDEPKGLGAVVKDSEGEKWVRVMVYGREPWAHNGNVGDFRAWRSYDDIDVVEKLSEGVTE